MTLKQAAEFLANTPTPYSLVYLRKVVKSGTLKATLNTDTPSPFWTVEEADLMAWAATPRKRGNPEIKNIRRKGQKKASNTK